jgi:hypothetical protein
MKSGTLILAISALATGQTRSEAVLTFEIDNVVAYYDDGTPYSKVGTSTAVTPVPSDFFNLWRTYVWIGDLTSVNGAPARGTLIMPSLALGGGPAPAARRPIYDVARNQIANAQVDVQDAAGRDVGVFCFAVLGAGAIPPGGPAGAGAGAFAVTGGTGAFLGVAGQGGTVSNVGWRAASMLEDASLRRVHGGGKWIVRFLVTGVKRPEIAAAYHASDFSLVSESSPARAGETLILAAKGIGPTRPPLAPDAVFASNPLQVAAATVEATVNSKPATCANAVGWPESDEVYRVDLTLPGGLEGNKAMVVLSRGYIPGIPFVLPVRP